MTETDSDSSNPGGSRLFTRARPLVPGLLLMAAVSLGLAAPSVAHAGLRDLVAGLFERSHSFSIELNATPRKLRLRVAGDIVFNTAEDDVESLKGRAIVRETRDGRVFRIDFKSDAAVGVKRVYSVDGRERPLDAEGRRWLAEVIPVLLRESAIDCERRIKRLLAKGGADAVLTEIGKIETGYARGRYIAGLAKAGPLDAPRLTQLLAAVAPMDSDYERRMALTAILGAQPLAPAQQSALLDIVANMDSSYEQRLVMQALLPALSNEAAVAAAWKAAVERIDSDYEVRSIIESMARRSDLSAAQLDLALATTLTLDSDFERASALTTLLKHLAKATPAQLAAYLQSAQAIDSDYERARTLTALLGKIALDKNGLAGVLRATEGMGSDHELCNVLKSVARHLPADTELVARYRKVARKLGDFERAQAERAIDHLG